MRFVTPSALKARLEKWHIMFEPLSSRVANIVARIKQEKLANEFYLKESKYQVNETLQYWYHLIEFPLIQKQEKFSGHSGLEIAQIVESYLTNPRVVHKESYGWYDQQSRLHKFNILNIYSDELAKFHYHIVLVYELVGDKATITLHFTSRELQF